ncbi:ArnT family glycosyltransferase [Alteraurantiacibacter aestuarii]|uniref:Glycosyltransferase RgtA/B/C/D-like domain-containing protein n=1 Tax=Alteraurantiacibacter aestuarii TaxID=650004 RepID=A0A844ZP85_9SPHN|nr:hypothetical protein [Alteraurantiacibacter aestuarii]MXO88830.1 hypothetical protein [Alteraurantiacibacter aestuarii]
MFIAKRPGSVSALICVLFFIFLFLTMNREIDAFDESIILVNAQRVLAGDVIHRDFYSNYGPGSPYLVAAVFWLFGPKLLAARLFGLVLMAVPAGLVTYLLVRRVPFGLALGGSLACAMFIYVAAFHLYPVYPCLVLILASAIIVLREDILARPGLILTCGGLTGIVALFRYDTGFFTLVAFSIYLLAIGPGKTIPARIAAAIRPVLTLAVGAALAFAPFAIYFLATAQIADFWADIVEHSAPYAANRGLPFPGPGAIMADPAVGGVYIPLLVTLAALAELWRSRASGAGQQAGQDFLILFTLLTVILTYKGLVRVSLVHMLLAIVPAITLAAFLAQRWASRRGHWRSAAIVLSAVAVFAVAGSFNRLRADVGAIERTATGGLLFAGSEENPPCVEGSPPFVGLTSADYSRAVAYLDAHVPDGERILVGLDRHDKVFANGLSIYFLADRLPGTKWAQFDPGVTNTAGIQREIIDDLRKYDVQWIVRDASFENVTEPNLSSVSSGVLLLDSYLARNFRKAFASGKVEVWLRNDVPAPAPDGA